MTDTYYKKRKRKRNDILYAFLLAILFHLIFFLLIFINPDFLNLQSKKPPPKEDKDYIEITEYHDKETEPPEKSKLLAEKSHKAVKESAPDKTTRLTKPPSPKPSQAKKPVKPKEPKKVAKKEPEKKKTEKKPPEKKPVEEKIKTNDEVLRDHKLAKLPKQKWLRDKKNPNKDLKEIGREILKSNPAEYPSPYSSTQPSKVGARNVPKSEDTVDLNTTEFKYYSYFLGLKRQIEGVWHYPPDAARRGEHGSLNLIFTIKSNGDLDGIQIVSSTGFKALDGEALRAIKVAAPFHPFPKSWQGLEKLNVKATFEYTYRNFLR